MSYLEEQTAADGMLGRHPFGDRVSCFFEVSESVCPLITDEDLPHRQRRESGGSLGLTVGQVRSIYLEEA